MSRYIDADAFEAFGYEVNGGSDDFKDGFDEGVQFVLECIDNVPTADVRPNFKGEWIPIEKGEKGYSAGDFRCSVCGLPNKCYSLTPYCCNCGAYMRGDMKI